MSDLLSWLRLGWVDAAKCSPSQNIWMPVILTTAPLCDTDSIDIKNGGHRYFFLKNALIYKGEWSWEVSINGLPEDVYKCLCDKETRVLSWKQTEINDLSFLPRCAELTPGKVEVYWGLG